MSSSSHIEKSPEYDLFHPWLGDGLLTTKGEKWKNHRKIIAPTFHLNVLKSFVPTFYKHSMGIVDKLQQHTGSEFDIHEYMSQVTVDILLGKNFNFLILRFHFNSNIILRNCHGLQEAK